MESENITDAKKSGLIRVGLTIMRALLRIQQQLDWLADSAPNCTRERMIKVKADKDLDRQCVCCLG
jgi:hypothetical protein